MANFFIVENHHEVLIPWAALRQQLPQAPRLITLDHHTDTSAPFRHHLRHLAEPAFSQEQKRRLDEISIHEPESIKHALTSLAHDEHIVAALKKDILSTAFVIAHNACDTDIQTFQQHKIACYSVGRDPASNAVTRAECDEVLESSFLDGALAHFQQILQVAQDEPIFSKPYILDIDMDVFNTHKSLCPKNADVFERLIQGATLITAALEPRHFKMCSLEKNFTAEEALIEFQRRFLKTH